MILKNNFKVFLRLKNSYATSCNVKENKTALKSSIRNDSSDKIQDEIARSFGDANFNETEYYFQDGLRKVYPYYFKHSAYCKGRWLKRSVIDVYSSEFAYYPKEEYEKRIANGLLKVNGKNVGVNYILKDKDLLTSVVHRHELPVLACPIRTLYEDDDVCVVEKPPSIPVHPCGLYRHNTLLFILAKEYSKKNMYVAHRLDRLTSGVLILAKSHEKSRQLHDEMNLRNITKEYICRVEGNFPDTLVTVNKPLKQIYHRMGVSIVDSTGKVSITDFVKLSYNGKSSVVFCRPHTGRTHQIRVHLQYLGYPIINDPLYNSYVFGPEKGKYGQFHKTIDQLIVDLVKYHTSLWYLEDPPDEIKHFKISNNAINHNLLNSTELMKYYVPSNMGYLEKYKKDPSKVTYDKDCHFCLNSYKDPKHTNLIMFLHAFRYKGQNWEFKSDMPKWSSEKWMHA